MNDQLPRLDWSGTFVDTRLEARFLQSQFGPMLFRAKMGTLVVAGLTFLTVVVDVVRTPELLFPLLPNRIAVAAMALLFTVFAPRDVRGVWQRGLVTLSVYSLGLAHQHVLRVDPPFYVQIWITFAVFGGSVWRIVPTRLLPLMHLWTVAVLLGAAWWVGQGSYTVGMPLVSALAIAPLLVFLTGQQESAERLFQAQTWRATALAESRETVLAAVAHELRTPLSVARMAVGVARKFPEQSVPLLERIDRRLVGLSELVDAVLSLGSLDIVEKREEVALHRLAEEVFGDLRDLHPETQIDVVGAALTAGDRALWRTALLNLAENGIRFAERRLRCTLMVHEIWVEDDGPGVPEADRTRIFEPMVRLDDEVGEHPGFGLGLALTLRVVRAHGGDVWVSKSEWGGAKFVMRLPLYESDPVVSWVPG